MNVETFQKTILGHLHDVPVGARGQYKTAVACALADLEKPAYRTSKVYANRLGEPKNWPRNSRWQLDKHECMVDISFMSRKKAGAPWKVQLTAEVEADKRHLQELRDGDDSHDVGYFWDLYKLLQLPSPVRVFVAVVGKRADDERVSDRLMEYALLYTDRFAEGDELFIVVVRDADEQKGWLRTRQLRMDRRLREVRMLKS